VWLDDPAVSRHHARIERGADGFVLRDLGSRNGTWVGPRRIDEAALPPGRTIRIGGARLTFKPGFGPDDLTLVDAPARSIGPRRPVVFIPGLTGSELWRGRERVWPNPRLLLSDPEVFRLPEKEPLRAGAVIGEVVIVPNLVKVQAYSRIGEYLVDSLGYERGRDLLEFGYDWRQDVRDSARGLAEAVDSWRVKEPITLIAHSLGCLVARYYVDRLGGDRRVGRLILMGGPHLGTPGAVAGLVLGPRLLPFGLMGDRLRAVAATFPSAYQIVPTYRCALDRDGRPIDLLADDSWLAEAQRPLLRSACAFWSELGAGSRVPATSVFGYGGRTVTGLRVTRDTSLRWRQLDLVHEQGGDCSVPVVSALLEGSDMHPVRQEHGALFVDRDVRMRLKLELTASEEHDAGFARP
jgi:pimeloyl-ACP methyl ester carboxylesterase